MTQEDKQLLLKDICARLPYGVMVHATIDGDNALLGVYNDRVFTACEEYGKHNDYPLDCIKPYLRPMSSMTKEEKKEYHAIDSRAYTCPEDIAHTPAADRIDWLNKNHFDYRGLIGKGLAIEAPEGIYKTE